MERVSASSALGSCSTRPKTLSAPSQAMLSRGWRRACQSLATIFSGSGSAGALETLRRSENLPPALNCQSSRVWAPGMRTLQKCQRAISTLVGNQPEVFLGLGDAQHFFDGGAAGFDLHPAVVAQRAHPTLDGFLRQRAG